MGQKMTTRQMETKVRAILKQNFDAARWVAGGYMLRGKKSVHNAGFRIYKVSILLFQYPFVMSTTQFNLLDISRTKNYEA